MSRYVKVNAALALLAFLLLLGTVGGMEHERIGFTYGMIRAAISLALAVFFTYRAGGFYGQEDEDE